MDDSEEDLMQEENEADEIINLVFGNGSDTDTED